MPHVRLPSRAGTKTFAEAAHQATQNDCVMHASVQASLKVLVSIDAQAGKLDAELKEPADRKPWRQRTPIGSRSHQGCGIKGPVPGPSPKTRNP